MFDSSRETVRQRTIVTFPSICYMSVPKLITSWVAFATRFFWTMSIRRTEAEELAEAAKDQLLGPEPTRLYQASLTNGDLMLFNWISYVLMMLGFNRDII